LQIVVYIHSGFFEIGFVFTKTGPICRRFSTIVEQVINHGFRGFHGFGECVYTVSHLPIFSSTHKPLAYLFGTYYTQKRLKNKQNLFPILDSCLSSVFKGVGNKV
jgi:hypothetical protein